MKPTCSTKENHIRVNFIISEISKHNIISSKVV